MAKKSKIPVEKDYKIPVEKDYIQQFTDSRFGVVSVHAYDDSKLSTEQVDFLAERFFQEQSEVVKGDLELKESNTASK